MSKNIKNRDGLFKTIGRYKNEHLYEKRQKELEENPIKLEKNDKFALFISSFLVIFLPCVLILLLIVFIALLFFRII